MVAMFFSKKKNDGYVLISNIFANSKELDNGEIVMDKSH